MTRVIRALLVAATLLVAGGVVAATAVDRSPAVVDTTARVGAAGLGLQNLDADRTPGPSNAPTTLVPVPPSLSSTVAPRPRVSPSSTVTTRAIPGPTTSTTVVLRPAPATSTTLLPSPPLGSGAPTTWSAERDGVSLRMRMEPSAPVAGQPVRFVVDIISVQPCCATGLNFGDSADYLPVAPGNCSGGSDVTDFAVSHTYQHPGNYTVQFVAATFPCNPTVVGGVPVPPSITGTSIKACVAVGPGVVGSPEC